MPRCFELTELVEAGHIDECTPVRTIRSVNSSPRLASIGAISTGYRTGHAATIPWQEPQFDGDSNFLCFLSTVTKYSPAIVRDAIRQDQMCGLIGIRNRHGRFPVVASPPLQITVHKCTQSVCVWVWSCPKRIAGDAIEFGFEIAKEDDAPFIIVGLRRGRSRARRPNAETVVAGTNNN